MIISGEERQRGWQRVLLFQDELEEERGWKMVMSDDEEDRGWKVVAFPEEEE